MDFNGGGGLTRLFFFVSSFIFHFLIETRRWGTSLNGQRKKERKKIRIEEGDERIQKVGDEYGRVLEGV